MQLLRRELGAALVGVGVAGDQRQALGSGVEVEALEHAPDAVLGDPDPTPLLPREFGGDPPGAKAGVPEGKASTRCSRWGPIWLGIRGLRRSLTRSPSRP